MTADREKLIRERAYEIWESEGSPAGKHDQHWEQARREVAELGKSSDGEQPSAEPGDSAQAAAQPKIKKSRQKREEVDKAATDDAVATVTTMPKRQKVRNASAEL